MNNLKNESNAKARELKLEVVRFDSADVIATSVAAVPTLDADPNELIAPINPTYNPANLGGGSYNEPTSGQ